MTAPKNILQTIEDHHLTYHLTDEEKEELAYNIADNLGISKHADDYPDWSL